METGPGVVNATPTHRYLRYLEVNYDHEIPKDNDNPYPAVPGSVMHIAPPAGYGSGSTEMVKSR